MISNIYAPMKTGNIIQDPEIALVNSLTVAIAQAGVRVNQVDVTNLYVALKSRPLAILTGPDGTGKAALVECPANLLAGRSRHQRQIVSGHAWYAGGRLANTTLIGMHARMITEKLLFIIEEASQPEIFKRFSFLV